MKPSATILDTPFPSFRPDGHFGRLLDRMLERHVLATDPVKLASLFRGRTKDGWQTEFWGKYMHAAVPFWRYTGSAELGRRIVAGVREILSLQEPDGYIGNYAPEDRFTLGWDVWGAKYTLMGLLHYHDLAARFPELLPAGAPPATAALGAAVRLCDCLAAARGPEGRLGPDLRLTGMYGGMPSLSVLEPVVWLYRRTGEPRFLAFADHVVRQMTQFPDGPQLLKLAGVPVADRRFGRVPPFHAKNPEHALTKAYEMMSCYQGLVEYAEACGSRGAAGGPPAAEPGDILAAAVASARSIAETEINLAGGGSAGEHWYHGADEQWRHVSWLQETCVTTTWMRLCETLRAATGDPFWTEQLERTFHNAYLAAMNRDCDAFACYTPLLGSRAHGHHQLHLHENCCNANGPRGWLCLLDRVFTAEGDAATLDLYMSGLAEAEIPALGRTARFRVYTLYPREGGMAIGCENAEPLDFALRLRIPSFAEGATVAINGEAVDAPAPPGGYCELRRTWRSGDRICLVFRMPVRMHVLHDHVAFTRGPVLLARDSRFGDGALDEEVRDYEVTERDLAGFRLTRADDPAMFMTVTGILPMGSHSEDVDQECHPRAVRFADYASAGNAWRPDNRYRAWLPALVRGRTY